MQEMHEHACAACIRASEIKTLALTERHCVSQGLCLVTGGLGQDKMSMQLGL